MINSYAPPESGKFVQQKSCLNIKAIIAFVAIPLVVGCVNMPSSKTQAPGAENKIITGPVLDGDISTFLASAAPFSISEFPSTPWGKNVLLRMGEPYFSASGRNCRKITVLDIEGNESLQLACEFRDGSWEPVRLVTQLLGTR
jgi:hypothetical protein